MTADENRAEGHVPAQNRTLSDFPCCDGSQATPDRDEAREARFAVAICRHHCGYPHPTVEARTFVHRREASAVMAVASAEVEEATAALRAEVERLRGEAAGMTGMRNAARRRAEAAESRERALREAVEALAGELERGDLGYPTGGGEGYAAQWAFARSSDRLRAVLAQAAPTGAASPTTDPDPAADTQNPGRWCDVCKARGWHHTDRHEEFVAEAAANSEGEATR